MCFQTILTSKCLSAAPGNSKYTEFHRVNYGQYQERAHYELSLPNGGNVGQIATVGRRRKGTSAKANTGFSAGAPIKHHNDMHLSGPLYGSEFKELHSALQDREAVIQKLRIQLCLGKLPRHSGPPFSDSEIPAAKRQLQKLRMDAENKKTKIRNLKSALEHFHINDNIDLRIRQAELEYSLGREELQLLSIIEDTRALQARLEKTSNEPETLYSSLLSGTTYNLYALEATTGRWAAQTHSDSSGAFFIEWALEGDGLYKGDRILEINGHLVHSKMKEEFLKLVGNSGKCKLVVLRRKSTASIPAHFQLKGQDETNREKENNLRLQHRISYLEEQVKELQASIKYDSNSVYHHNIHHTLPQHYYYQEPKKGVQMNGSSCSNSSSNNSGHVTSISIPSRAVSSRQSDSKPTIFQRGNYITTLVGGKPIELLGEEEHTVLEHKAHLNKCKSTAHITKTLIGDVDDYSHVYVLMNTYPETSKIANNHHNLSTTPYMNGNANETKMVKEAIIQHPNDDHITHNRHHSKSLGQVLLMDGSVDLLNQHTAGTNGVSSKHSEVVLPISNNSSGSTPHLHTSRWPSDMCSVKSLDCSSDNESISHSYNKLRTKLHQALTGEGRSIRPTPPKKPLRLSLQRAQSLQTVELNPISESDRKRATKRAHITERCLNGTGEDQNTIVTTNLPGDCQTQSTQVTTAESLQICSLDRQQEHLESKH